MLKYLNVYQKKVTSVRGRVFMCYVINKKSVPLKKKKVVVEQLSKLLSGRRGKVENLWLVVCFVSEAFADRLDGSYNVKVDRFDLRLACRSGFL